MTSHEPTISSTWAIQDTANHTISIATGLLAAATSDDINPVALVCCASFGAVLPVAIDTRVKIEQLARRNHTSHVLNFIKATIGYKLHDSVEQLSRSDSGIRFLCLCATLCTFDNYEAADCLDVLLQTFQDREQIRPTIKQLQVMLVSMKTKLALSDFASSVAGFEVLIRSQLTGLGEGFAFQVARLPNKKSLRNLVMAIHEIGQPQPEDTTPFSCEVKLRAHHAPWTCAFVRWFLGTPPHIRTSTGSIILSQPSAVISLTIVVEAAGNMSSQRPIEADDEHIALIKKHKVRRLRELVFHDSNSETARTWQGLVPPDTWFRFHFGVLHARFPELSNDSVLRSATGQALGFIVKHLPEHLLLCRDISDFKLCLELYGVDPFNLVGSTSPKPFLNVNTRWAVARSLVSKHIDLIDSGQEKQNTLIPQNLATRLSGACGTCAGHPDHILVGSLPCRVKEYLDAVGVIGSTLLLMTLFGTNIESYPMLAAGLKFNTSQFHGKVWQDERHPIFSMQSFSNLVSTGWQSLMHERCSMLVCPLNAIFKFAAEMLGHEKILDSVILSSKSSQAIFPVVFEAQSFMLEGYMQLCSFPGKLMWNGMEFDFLIDQSQVDLSGTRGPDVEELRYNSTYDMDARAGNDARDSELYGDEAGVGQSDGSPAEGNAQNLFDEEVSGFSTRETSTHESAVEERYHETDQTRLEQYDGPDSEEVTVGPPAVAPPPPVLMSADFRPSTITFPQPVQMKWKVSVQNDILVGELQFDRKTLGTQYQELSNRTLEAWFLFKHFAFTRLTPPCSHSSERTAGQLAERFEFHHGFPNMSWSRSPQAFFDTGQSYALQLWGLSSQSYWPPTVLHVEGCVRCALQFCIDTPSNLIIS